MIAKVNALRELPPPPSAPPPNPTANVNLSTEIFMSYLGEAGGGPR